MKFKHVVASLSLAMFAAFGVAAGLSMKKEAKAVKADESYSGSIIVQKNDNDAKWDGCNLVGYLFDNNSNSTWGTVVSNTSNKYQEYSWSLSFNPTTIIMVRVPTNWSSSWDNPWWDGNGGIYARTGNVTISTTDVIWMAGNAKEGSNWGTYELDAAVVGGDSDSWTGEPTVNVALSGVKVSGGNKLEAFGSVSLGADKYFKVVKEGSEWCGAYTAHSSIASNFSNSEVAGNIHNIEAGTYEFYFDYDAKTTYITDPARAAADEFAQSFLDKTVGYCSGSEAISEGVQAELKGEYDALHDIEGAQALFYGAEVKRGKGVDYESFASQALSRYVNMQEEKGYGDFLGLGAHNPEINPAIYSYLFANDTNNTAIIGLISGLCAPKPKKSPYPFSSCIFT